jgi:acetyl esterase/lipase
VRTVSYGEHPEQVADVSEPAGDRRAVPVAIVHGGCWRATYDRSLSDRLVGDLVRRGYETWNIEYRRLDAGGTWPEPVDDVVAALGLCPAPPLVVGHSAGGHLALLAAHRVAVAGVVAQAPITSLPDALRLGACRGAVERLLAAGAPSPDDDPVDVPTLVIHGEEDEHVPIEVSRGYRRGERSEVSGCRHMDHLNPASAAWQVTIGWLERHA